MRHRAHPVLLACVLAGTAFAQSAEDATASDAEMETFLREARVVASKEIGSGITRPRKLTLQRGDRNLSAAFKTVDIETVGVTQFADRSSKVNFTDRYVYERAAYLLDRRLGLSMVPVTVLRSIDGEEGALIAWVTDAITEKKRRADGKNPPDPGEFIRQRAQMRVFDALILNDDRHLGNQLYSTADWKLHLIDHSRSFRMQKSLPKEFAGDPVRLPRDLHTALAGLEKRELETLLHGLMSKARIAALLARRDAILKKVERDRKKLGDAFVFLEDEP